MSITTRVAKSAVDAPTQFLESRGRRLAYRDIGEGPPLVLCLRFRGVLDVWDPAFLDALARGFRVITFDYSGLGRSTGEPSYDPRALARDALDVVDGLELDPITIGGWSIGGLAAQVFTALHPERTTHAVLIATGPPGPQPNDAEPLFLQLALKPENTLEDEHALFFEPTSAGSRAASNASHDRIAARSADRSPPTPPETYTRLLRERHDPSAIFVDDGNYAEKLAASSVPLLALCGDHDIVFPVENWYSLNRRWRSLFITTVPSSGHAPQHQHPELCAEIIRSFVRCTR